MQRLRTNYREKGDSYFTAMPANPLPPELSTARTYGDVAGKGYELSATFNPNQNWRVMLTGSKNQTAISNQYPDVYEFLYTDNQYSAFAGFKTWNRFVAELNKVANGQRSTQFDLDPANPVHVQQARDDAAYLAQNIASQERRFIDSKATDGAVQVQNGEYALNTAVTYSFTREGWLKGWQVGGNARWRSAPIAGYYRFPNTTAGTPEGVISACALKCMGGEMQGKINPRNQEEADKGKAMGYDLDQVLTTEDLVSSDNVFFAATGITDGELLDGVKYFGSGSRTHSLVMRSKSGTVREIIAQHRLDKLMSFSAVAFD